MKTWRRKESTKRRRYGDRPFLTGNPEIDFKVKWDKYPLKLTEEEAQRNREFLEKSERDYFSTWPRGGARYQDEARYEQEFGKYSDQDLEDFAKYVNEYRKKNGVPRRDREKVNDEYLEALKRLYPGRAMPPIMRVTGFY